MIRAALILALLAGAAAAQESGGLGGRFKQPPERRQGPEAEYRAREIEPERPDSRSVARPLANLRGLDKISGRVTDFTAPVGETVSYERLELSVEACREPPDDAPPDAFAFLRIRDGRAAEPVFSGWMFASSPALSAMDHPRYDVWVLSCATS